MDLISKTIISKQLNIFQLPHDDLIEAVINLKLKSTYMGLFDFFKKKQLKSVYAKFEKTFGNRSKDGDSGIQFYKFGYDYFPNKIFGSPTNLLNEIYQRGKEGVIDHFTISCMQMGGFPKRTDIEKISVATHEDIDGKITVISFPITQGSMATGIPILPPIRIGLFHNSNDFRYFTLGTPPMGNNPTLREVKKNGANNRLATATSDDEITFIKLIKARI